MFFIIQLFIYYHVDALLELIQILQKKKESGLLSIWWDQHTQKGRREENKTYQSIDLIRK